MSDNENTDIVNLQILNPKPIRTATNDSYPKQQKELKLIDEIDKEIKNENDEESSNPSIIDENDQSIIDENDSSIIDQQFEDNTIENDNKPIENDKPIENKVIQQPKIFENEEIEQKNEVNDNKQLEKKDIIVEPYCANKLILLAGGIFYILNNINVISNLFS